ncbi:hypothetical protein GCM10023259_093520 [Thermocatellispora tengchongensis]|uniref:hypothetical protein n=1 Tax=Thermocatellispora tengchongensis TaxID=1073253 RepID=UPI0031ED2619
MLSLASHADEWTRWLRRRARARRRRARAALAAGTGAGAESEGTGQTWRGWAARRAARRAAQTERP